MKVFLISIGNELLTGKTINTNASWLGKKLTMLGCRVENQITIPDSDTAISNSIDYFMNTDCSCVIITGGLGPTVDDITRKALFDYFGTSYYFDEEYWNILEDRFKKRDLKIPVSNRNQALVPDNGYVIHNPVGTARGLKFKKNDKIIFSLPGVPIEMKSMFESEIKPWVSNQVEPFFTSMIRTTGIQESVIIEKIDMVLKKENDYTIGYYPSIDGVDIKITGKIENNIEKLCNNITSKLGDNVYCTDERSIEEVVVDKAIKNKITISLAESCTGGLIGHRITEVSGSSKIFKGGMIVYSNNAKINNLGISRECIKENGAVSEETALEMSRNIRSIFSTDIGISVTGIAGPTGNTAKKPVGLIFVGLSTKDFNRTRKFQFHSNRSNNKRKTSQVVLEWLRMELNDVK